MAMKYSALLKPITGSYSLQDCQFLLTEIEPNYVDVAEKEILIQSGAKHYSEMISFEHPPSEHYRALFHDLTEQYKARLASEILGIAEQVLKVRTTPLTIVSLARAGTPFGALLNRAFSEIFNVETVHYSISIIRDHGIDQNALKYILRDQLRPASGVFFVDTWTAKGVITGELKRAIQKWNQTEPEQLSDELFVISDIGGTADFAATYDDYAIPSGVMNATVSGLMSRSILNEMIDADQFHGSVYYKHLEDHDQSAWFLDEVSQLFSQVKPSSTPSTNRQRRRELSQQWISRWLEEFQIKDINHIKPGVAEATRVMLRRVPAYLILKDLDDQDVAHLRWLAIKKSVPLIVRPNMPFKAVAFIKALQLDQSSIT
jgi:hypothetical protein